MMNDAGIKRKVCHITSVHRRYDTRIFYKQCMSLSKTYDVYLLVNDDKGDEYINGVNIISNNIITKNKFSRIFKSLKSIKRKALTIDADIYHLHDPELLPLVKFLKKKGKKVIFDSHEDYPPTFLTKDWIPRLLRKPIKLIYEHIEKRAIKKADGAIVCYHWTYDRYKKWNDNVQLVYNFPIINDQIKSNTNIKKKYDLVYAGGIKEIWNHVVILDSISNTENKILYALAGPYDDSYMKILKKHENWDNVDYKGIIDIEEVMNIYQDSKIGVALLDYIPVTHYKKGNLANTKIFEYMYNKLPILCTDFDMWSKIVKEENCGIVVNPNNVGEISKAIDYLLNNPEEAKQMGLNGYKAVIEKYNWNNDSKKMFKLYEDILVRKEKN